LIEGSGERRSSVVQETVFYQDERVTVTQERVIIDDKTFPMANITSVSWSTESPKRLWPIVMLGLGGLVASVGLVVWILGDASTSWCTGLSTVIAVLGGLLFLSSEAKYIVTIGSASGETRALTTLDKEYAQRVAEAINEAIIQRG
jgi:hypothetical protein